MKIKNLDEKSLLERKIYVRPQTDMCAVPCEGLLYTASPGVGGDYAKKVSLLIEEWESESDGVLYDEENAYFGLTRLSRQKNLWE